jgi:hypothetical protein
MHMMHHKGDPSPDMLGPGETINLHLGFGPAGALATSAPAAPPADYNFGDESQAEVGVYLDGRPVGGFNVQAQPPERIFLPVMLKRQ